MGLQEPDAESIVVHELRELKGDKTCIKMFFLK